MITWIILASMLYFIVGCTVARQTYAIEQRHFLAIAASDEARQERIAEIKGDLGRLTHGICNINYDALRDRGCDCSSQRRWRLLNTELDELEAGGPLTNAPGPKYGVIATWPTTAIKNYLTPEISVAPQARAIEPAPEPRALEIDMSHAANYDGFRVFKDDPFGKEIREGWKRIKAQADAELAELKSKDPLAYSTEVDCEKVTVINGNGEVVSIFDADNPKGRRTASTGPLA